MSIPLTVVLNNDGSLWDAIVYLSLLEKNLPVVLRQGSMSPSVTERNLQLTEPLVILEYLNERYPDPALLPDELARRARARQLMHTIAAEIVAPAIQITELIREGSKKKVLLTEKQAELELRLKEISPLFRHQECVLGDELSIMDLMLGMVVLRHEQMGVKIPRNNPLLRYSKALRERPSFAKVVDWMSR